MAEADSYNFTTVIDDAKISGEQWLVLLVSLFTAMFDGYDTQGIAYVAPVMAKDLGFSPALLGPIFSSGLLGLTLGAFFFGVLADKIGRKQAIIWPMAIFGVFSLATPLGHDVTSLVILRFLAGFGLGGTLPNVTAYVLEYSPHRRLLRLRLDHQRRARQYPDPDARLAVDVLYRRHRAAPRDHRRRDLPPRIGPLPPALGPIHGPRTRHHAAHRAGAEFRRRRALHPRAADPRHHRQGALHRRPRLPDDLAVDRLCRQSLHPDLSGLLASHSVARGRTAAQCRDHRRDLVRDRRL